MSSPLRRLARHVVERALKPHLDEQADEIERRVTARLHEARESVADRGSMPDPVLVDFNHLLHELRTIELRRLPVDGGVLLSAGCAGRWYFDWLDDCAGPFDRHIGVELYSPRPDDLPPSVEWIAESASHMPTVEDASVDVVFSGQNIEHLWTDDLVGFLTEANRVLRDDGMLVVDSPNRPVVEALGWVHPEHTVEMSVAEAVALFKAAGFEPTVVRGLWRCRESSGGWMPLMIDPGDAREVLERAIGRRSVDDDFVWWIEARKAGPPSDSLAELVGELFESHWENRVNRAAESPFEADAGGGFTAPASAVGLVYRTNGFPLFPGRFSVSAGDPALRIRLVDADGVVLADAPETAAGTLHDARFGVRAEVHADRPLADATPLRVTVSSTRAG